MNFIVLYGSVRTERQGIKAARFLVNQLKSREHTVTLIDPMETPFPLLDKRFSDFEEGQAPEFMKKIADQLKKADGFVVVSGEYNHGIPPALKNLIDHYQVNEYAYRPAAIASYSMGPFGGVRAVSSLLDTLNVLGMVVVGKTLPISKVHEAFDEEGQALDEAYVRRAKGFLEELEWYAEALQNQRHKGLPSNK